MGSAAILDLMREEALRSVDELDDEVLLAPRRGIEHQIVQRHHLEVPRLHRAAFSTPRAVRRRVAGDPGRESAMVDVPATRVELWVLLEGFDTVARLAADGSLDLGAAVVNQAEHCLVIEYVSERPNADEANEYFLESLNDLEDRLEQVKSQVQAFNDSLPQAVDEALETARERALQRRRFAEGLTLPRPKAPWGRT